MSLDDETSKATRTNRFKTRILRDSTQPKHNGCSSVIIHHLPAAQNGNLYSNSRGPMTITASKATAMVLGIGSRWHNKRSRSSPSVSLRRSHLKCDQQCKSQIKTSPIQYQENRTDNTRTASPPPSIIYHPFLSTIGEKLLPWNSKTNIGHFFKNSRRRIGFVIDEHAV